MLGEGAFLHEEVRLEAGAEAVVHSGSVLVPRYGFKGWVRGKGAQDNDKHKHGVVEGPEAAARPDEVAYPPHVRPHAVVVSPVPLRQRLLGASCQRFGRHTSMTTRLMAQRRRSDRSWPVLKALLIRVSTLDLRTKGSTASLGCRPRSRACVTEDMSTAMWGNSGDCSIHGSMTARKAGGSPPPSMLTMLGATYSTTGHEEETTGSVFDRHPCWFIG